MNTLKTAVVVVVLLAVLYGVYRVLNMPDPQLLKTQLFPQPQSTPTYPNTEVPVTLGQPIDSADVGQAYRFAVGLSGCLRPSKHQPIDRTIESLIRRTGCLVRADDLRDEVFIGLGLLLLRDILPEVVDAVERTGGAVLLEPWVERSVVRVSREPVL